MTETYCNVLTIKKFRHFYSQFRTGKHFLEVERGRYCGQTKAERICKVCNSKQIEDEFHFILICHVYNDLRFRYLPKKYYTNPTLIKLYRLLANRNEKIIHDVSQYLYHAYHRRKDIITIL